MKTELYMVVGSAGANLRDYPSTSMGAIVQHMDKGDLVNVYTGITAINNVGSTTEYTAVEYGGRNAWVASSLIQPAPAHVVVTVSPKITMDGNTATVVSQSTRTGKWATELKNHGCGICCLATALTIKGKPYTPEQLMGVAYTLFGAAGKNELYGLSAKGAERVAKKAGIKAEALPVTSSTRQARKVKIDTSLKAGKPVLCWIKGEPFSRDTHHWVLAVGYTSTGKIAIANSGGADRIQFVTLDQLASKLYAGGAMTATDWLVKAAGSAGVVIIG